MLEQNGLGKLEHKYTFSMRLCVTFCLDWPVRNIFRECDS